MKITGRQKACAAVLAVVGAALVADRVFLGASQPNAAQAAAPATQPAKSANAPAAPKPVDSLADRLTSLQQGRQLSIGECRDAFAPAAAWFPQKSAAALEEPAGGVREQQFAQSHRLMAVMLDRRGDYAIIDGKALRLGQEMNGFRVTRVSSRSVLLEADGAKVELRLERAGGGNP